jgi:hypothetical protein
MVALKTQILEKAGPEGTVEVKTIRAALSRATNARFRAAVQTVMMGNAAKHWTANGANKVKSGSATVDEGSRACSVM